MAKLAAELQSLITPLGMTAAASGFVSGPRVVSGNPFHFINWPQGWLKLLHGNDFLLMDPCPAGRAALAGRWRVANSSVSYRHGMPAAG